MKFDFSLQSVLDVEIQLEKLVDLKLAKANAELEAAKRVLQSMQEELTLRQNDLSEMPQHSLQSVQTWNSFVGLMNQSIENQRLAIQTCEKTVDEIFQQKRFHKQRIEGLETLRANEEAEFEKRVAQREHKLLLESILQNQRAK